MFWVLRFALLRTPLPKRHSRNLLRAPREPPLMLPIGLVAEGRGPRSSPLYPKVLGPAFQTGGAPLFCAAGRAHGTGSRARIRRHRRSSVSRRRLGRKEVAVSGGACKRAGALSHKAVERLRLGNIDGTRERILCPVLFNIRWTDIATCNGGGTGWFTNFHRKLCQLPAADRSNRE